MSVWGRLSAKDQRALIWGALLLGPALAGNFVIRPYLRARATLGARVAEQRDLLARELSLLREAGTQGDDLRLVSASLDRQRVHLLAGRDPLAATAALVGLVGEEARTRGIEVQALESRPVERVGSGLTGVRIEVSARGDFEGLLRWLHALESDTRLLHIDWLTVAASEAADSAAAEQLGITAVVRAFVRDGAGAP
ncbi:MAG TPA: type II secretion system protein GspM [Gemmatimonadales bacterium]|nr:type II secretion system protein GspM [Gemmatimonadales bacterium]